MDKEKETGNVNAIPEPEEFERCIICGELTDILVSTPIDLRENYEVGCGQLCAECASKK